MSYNMISACQDISKTSLSRNGTNQPPGIITSSEGGEGSAHPSPRQISNFGQGANEGESVPSLLR